MNNSNSFENYRRSGIILSNALKLTKRIVKPNVKLLSIAEQIENYIRKQGAIPAFPVNISINEIAAHYSPIIEDSSVIPPKSVVKVDVGVAVNGYITDAARTFVFDKRWIKLQNAAKEALYSAIKTVKPNLSVYKLGEIIEQVISASGFRSIINLTGHSLARYSLHDGVSIPNFSLPRIYRRKKDVFLLNHAYAIEPFATDGIGRVRDGEEATIFKLLKTRDIKSSLQNEQYKKIYTAIREKFFGLPFSHRWLYNMGFKVDDIIECLEEFINKDIIHAYPTLIEEGNGTVAQWEDTIYVTQNRVYILTKREQKKETATQ